MSFHRSGRTGPGHFNPGKLSPAAASAATWARKPKKEIFTFSARNAFFLRILYVGTRVFISSLREVTDWTALAVRARFKVRPLAKLLGRTPYQLRVFFRLEHDCTTKEWLIRLRRAKSEELLCDRRYRIGHIADVLSFHDRSHFAHEFKAKHPDLTATRWRNNHARHNPEPERLRAASAGAQRLRVRQPVRDWAIA